MVTASIDEPKGQSDILERLAKLSRWMGVMIDEDRDPGPLEEFEVEDEIPFDGKINPATAPDGVGICIGM